MSELERDGGSAKEFFRISAAGLIGVENGQRVGHGVPGFKQVMVGDDEVKAEGARGFRFSEGAHAGVNGDDQAHAVGIGGLKHAGLEAVALAKAMGDVKADHAAEHLDGGLEQDDGGGAVHIVVAIEQDGLVELDGLFEAQYGRVHAEHELRVVEVGDFRIQEGEGCFGIDDAAGDEQFGEHLRDTGCCRKGRGHGKGVRGLLCQLPALIGTPACRWDWLRRGCNGYRACGFRGPGFSACRAHCAYSSSSRSWL